MGINFIPISTEYAEFPIVVDRQLPGNIIINISESLLRTTK